MRELRVNRAQAIGHLHMLWWWAADNAEDGNLEPFPPADIADAAGFSGNATTLIRALQTAGFCDGMMIHDWQDYIGKLLAYREKKRKAEATRRRKARGNVAGTVAGTLPTQCQSTVYQEKDVVTEPEITRPWDTDKSPLLRKDGSFAPHDYSPLPPLDTDRPLDPPEAAHGATGHTLSAAEASALTGTIGQPGGLILQHFIDKPPLPKSELRLPPRGKRR